MCNFTVEFLEKIVKECKILKSEYIIIKGGSLIGTDQFLTYIRRTDFDIDGLDSILSFYMKDMTDLLKIINLNDRLIYNNDAILLLDENGELIKTVYINDKITDYHILNILEEKCILGYNDYVFHLSENEEFMNALNGRVAEGMSIINLPYNDKFLPITVYGGFLPVNKNDKVQARLKYDYFSPTFDIKYEITKKKNKLIEVYSSYLKL